MEKFPRYWPVVRGIHRSPVNSPHKGQWRGALMFSFISARINGWVNNGKAGDLRRYRAHYDVIVMHETTFSQNTPSTSMWCIRTEFSSCVYNNVTHQFVFPGNKRFETNWLITVQPHFTISTNHQWRMFQYRLRCNIVRSPEATGFVFKVAQPLLRLTGFRQHCYRGSRQFAKAIIFSPSLVISTFARLCNKMPYVVLKRVSICRKKWNSVEMIAK